MRVLSCLLFVLLVSFSIQKTESVVIESKKILVDGSTSIGDFTCKYETKTQDTLFLNQKESYHYKIAVKDFGCGNFLLNRDFRKTLKESEYPEVVINMLNVKRSGDNYLYTLQVDLAGKRKHFHNLLLSKKSNVLQGNVVLKFGDFNLHPPQKLGGAIKINEEIKLSILLKIKT